MARPGCWLDSPPAGWALAGGREGSSLRPALFHGNAGGARNSGAVFWFSAALRPRAMA